MRSPNVPPGEEPSLPSTSSLLPRLRELMRAKPSVCPRPSGEGGARCPTGVGRVRACWSTAFSKGTAASQPVVEPSFPHPLGCASPPSPKGEGFLGPVAAVAAR
jgi:hypothetical protein